MRLNRVTQGASANFFGKSNSINPGGSIKDRIGAVMIEDAERKGLIKPGGTIVEGTSGNTGVGLAIAAAIKGYKCVFVLPDKMSEEKIRNLRSFGAQSRRHSDRGRAGGSAQLLSSFAQARARNAQLDLHEPVRQSLQSRSSLQEHGSRDSQAVPRRRCDRCRHRHRRHGLRNRQVHEGAQARQSK